MHKRKLLQIYGQALPQIFITDPPFPCFIFMSKPKYCDCFMGYINEASSRSLWPSGLTYHVTAVKCCMVCIRSQVQILLEARIYMDEFIWFQLHPRSWSWWLSGLRRHAISQLIVATKEPRFESPLQIMISIAQKQKMVQKNCNHYYSSPAILSLPMEAISQLSRS